MVNQRCHLPYFNWRKHQSGKTQLNYSNPKWKWFQWWPSSKRLESQNIAVEKSLIDWWNHYFGSASPCQGTMMDHDGMSFLALINFTCFAALKSRSRLLNSWFYLFYVARLYRVSVKKYRVWTCLWVGKFLCVFLLQQKS